MSLVFLLSLISLISSTWATPQYDVSAQWSQEIVQGRPGSQQITTSQAAVSFADKEWISIGYGVQFFKETYFESSMGVSPEITLVLPAFTPPTLPQPPTASTIISISSENLYFGVFSYFGSYSVQSLGIRKCMRHGNPGRHRSASHRISFRKHPCLSLPRALFTRWLVGWFQSTHSRLYIQSFLASSLYDIVFV